MTLDLALSARLPAEYVGSPRPGAATTAVLPRRKASPSFPAWCGSSKSATGPFLRRRRTSWPSPGSAWWRRGRGWCPSRRASPTWRWSSPLPPGLRRPRPQGASLPGGAYAVPARVPPGEEGPEAPGLPRGPDGGALPLRRPLGARTLMASERPDPSCGGRLGPPPRFSPRLGAWPRPGLGGKQPGGPRPCGPLTGGASGVKL